MERSSRRPQRSSSWGRRVPSALLLALVLVTCVLVLPAPASAVVDKSHARVYAATISALARRQTGNERLYSAYLSAMVGLATEMEPLLSSLDPDDQATVASDQAAAGRAYKSYKSTYRELNQVYLDYVKSFYDEHKSWFKSHEDKIHLDKASTKFANGLRYANSAFAKLAAANMALSDKDVATARARNSEASALILKANPAIKEGLNGLRALRR
jgi:hypothetical protein